ncbi:MAG: cytochrome P450 [Solirubrobacteraceae bacterium]
MSPLPPGPAESPALQTARWLLRPISFLERCRREFGDTFSVSFLGFATPMVMLSTPETIRALYSERGHGLPPGRTVSLRPIMGARSVLLLEGAEHMARRRVMLPPFHGDRMRAYEPIVRETAAREIATWPRDSAFAVHPSMQAITLEVILRAVFGVADEARRARLRTGLGQLLKSSSSIGLQFSVLASRRLGGPDPMARLKARLADVDAVLADEIAERRADLSATEERADICSLLVRARFDDGSEMPDEEIRDQMMTLLLAGHETTATALAWTLDLLTRHPAALARLQAEVDTGQGDAYLRATTAEALRLRPVVPLAGRRLTSELRAGDLVLPAGTDVTPAIWLAHTRPEEYPEPYAFRPERFLDKAPSTYAWIPYGGGVRRCLGAAFAEMEMRVVLTEVLRARAVRARSAGVRAERVARRNVTFSPRGGTRILAGAR